MGWPGRGGEAARKATLRRLNLPATPGTSAFQPGDTGPTGPHPSFKRLHSSSVSSLWFMV
jgi:hypothetical protein